MAILSKEDFMTRLSGIIGDNTNDESLSLIEDMTDTYNDLETRATSSNGDEWKQKYEENDKQWREKYRARFFDGGTSASEVKAEQKENVVADGEERTFEDLFVEREG